MTIFEESVVGVSIDGEAELAFKATPEIECVDTHFSAIKKWTRPPRFGRGGLDKSWRKPTLAPVGTTIGPGGLTAVFGMGTGVSLRV